MKKVYVFVRGVSVVNVTQVRYVVISDCRIHQSTAVGYSVMAYQNLRGSGLPGLEVEMGKRTHRQHDDQKRNFFLFRVDNSATG